MTAYATGAPRDQLNGPLRASDVSACAAAVHNEQSNMMLCQVQLATMFGCCEVRVEADAGNRLSPSMLIINDQYSAGSMLCQGGAASQL